LNQPLEINISPANGELSALPAGILTLGRRLLRYHIFKGFRPWAQKITAVAERAGQSSFVADPSRASTNGCSTITVMSANLWHDWPRLRRQQQRLEAFSQLVEQEQVDVLLLQEISRTPTLHVDAWLGERLGMAYVYSRANGHYRIGFEEGLGIFSRFSIRDPQLTQLGRRSNPFVRRIALGATIKVPCEPLTALSVHLGLSRRHNELQTSDLHRWVAESSAHLTALVGGDFNAFENSPQIRKTQSIWLDAFRYANPHGDGSTHTFRLPWGGMLHAHRLDYLFLHNDHSRWKVIEASHLSTPGHSHSDHKSVLVRLEPNPTGGSLSLTSIP
jgi:endonuclease/exonuclease/phosphatase family metal-dependent hydrolase